MGLLGLFDFFGATEEGDPVIFAAEDNDHEALIEALAEFVEEKRRCEQLHPIISSYRLNQEFCMQILRSATEHSTRNESGEIDLTSALIEGPDGEKLFLPCRLFEVEMLKSFVEDFSSVLGDGYDPIEAIDMVSEVYMKQLKPKVEEAVAEEEAEEEETEVPEEPAVPEESVEDPLVAMRAKYQAKKKAIQEALDS